MVHCGRYLYCTRSVHTSEILVRCCVGLIGHWSSFSFLNSSCSLRNFITCDNIVLLSPVKYPQESSRVSVVFMSWLLNFDGVAHCFVSCICVYKVIWYVEDDRCQMKVFVFTSHTLILHLLLPSSGNFLVLKWIKYVIVHSLCVSWMRMWDSGFMALLVTNFSAIRGWVISFIAPTSGTTAQRLIWPVVVLVALDKRHIILLLGTEKFLGC